MKIVYLFAIIDEAIDSILFFKLKKLDKKPFDTYENEDMILVISGVGIANSASCVAWIKQEYKIFKIINLGLVGCINDENKVLDVIYVSKAYYSAVDLTCFGYKYGQQSFESEYFVPTIKNILQLKEVAIASCDIFINNKFKVTQFISNLDDKIEVCDMECASIFHIAKKFEINVCSYKIISDTISQSNQKTEYESILAKARKKINDIILEINKQKDVILWA